MDLEDSPHSPDEDTSMPEQNPKYKRSLRSLHVLTTKFVQLLQESETGELDLRDVSEPTQYSKHLGQHVASNYTCVVQYLIALKL